MMNWKNEQLFDWICENPPAWGHNIIRNLDHDYPVYNEYGFGARQFVYLIERTSRNVDPDTIVGQWDHYAGQTWLDAIFNPNYKPGKIRNCLSKVDSNPDYYFASLNDIHLSSFDGKNWYSHTSGNHRTIIGKFILAMAQAKTGNKYFLPSVSTTCYHIDQECFDLYRKLSLLIQEKKVKITLDARSEPMELLASRHEIKIFVMDDRMGSNYSRYGWLSATEFCKYAKWELENEGEYPFWYRVKQTLGLIPGFEKRKLFYPAMSGQYVSAPRLHSISRTPPDRHSKNPPLTKRKTKQIIL